MYLEEHRNLENLRKSVERQTGKETAAYAMTGSNGNKIYEIILGADIPALSTVIRMEESFADYRGAWAERVLHEIMAVYENFGKMEGTGCCFGQMKDCLHIQLMNYEKNKWSLKNLPCCRFLDLAVVPVLAWREDREEMTFSIMRNIQRGEWHGSIEELLQTACENEENTCMVEGLESSAEEWGFEAYAMSNGFYCAAMDRQSLRALSEEIQNESLFLIPSSVCEMLVIPEDNVFDVGELREFADRLNTSLESERAFLSESIYRFSRKKNTLEIL